MLPDDEAVDLEISTYAGECEDGSFALVLTIGGLTSEQDCEGLSDVIQALLSLKSETIH